MQRSYLLFLNSVKSKATQKAYEYYLNKFMSTSGYEKDYDKLANTDPLKIQILVEDYVLSIKNKVNPNSIPTYVYPIQSFLDSNDIDLKWKKIKRLYPANIKKRGKSAYTTEQVQTLLNVSPDIRSELMIHIMASTGCRIGALFDLKIEHITILKDGFTAIKFYDDDIEEYTSFLTPEASEVLQRYFNQRRTDGEILTPDSPVFRARYRFGKQPVFPMTKRAFEQIVNRALKKSGLRSPDDKKNNRYEIPVNHGFRKRFITILKSIDKIPVAYTERMAGHMVYTDEHNNKIQLDDSYLRPELEKLLSFFKLAVPDLTINQEERLKLENELQQEKLTELERNKTTMQEAKKDLEVKGETIKDMQSQIDKLFYLNQVQNDYLKQGKFPEIEIKGNKKIIKYRSLNELERD